MVKSRSKNTLLNIFYGYFAQIGILILSFIGRKLFLNYLSVDYLGINGLFSNILTVLSLAELGLDSAVIYSLYKPVADNDNVMIYSLLKYFRRIYYWLAVAIFALGLIVIPFLPLIVKSDLSQSDLIIYYLLFLTNTVVSYFVAHKIALLSAFQQQRVQKLVLLSSNLILQVAHIAVLVIWHNYYIYIIATVFSTVLNNIILGCVCNRLHKDVFLVKFTVVFDKKPILQRIGSTFLYKIGAIAINNTDNILISVIVSTAAVGLYSNYGIVITAIQGFIGIITASLISGVGNLSACGNKDRQYEIFNITLFFYHFIGALGGIGFSMLLNDLVYLWLGEAFMFDSITVVIIAVNFYLTTIVTPIWMYREANGLFRLVSYLMLIRAAFNIVLSVLFGIIWGVFGILLATAASLILTSAWYEPQILFRNVFQKSSGQYWRKQMKYFGLTLVAGILSYLAIYKLPQTLPMFLLKTVIIIGITSVCFGLSVLQSKEFSTIKSLIKRR